MILDKYIIKYKDYFYFPAPIIFSNLKNKSKCSFPKRFLMLSIIASLLGAISFFEVNNFTFLINSLNFILSIFSLTSFKYSLTSLNIP